jgi:hypothetical protein
MYTYKNPEFRFLTPIEKATKVAMIEAKREKEELMKESMNILNSMTIRKTAIKENFQNAS